KKAAEARAAMLKAYNDMQHPATREGDAQKWLAEAEAELSNAEATVRETQRDIETAKTEEERLKGLASRVAGAERDGYEKSVKEQWMKYTTWERQDLPRAQRRLAAAKDKVAKARSEAG